MVLAHCFQTGGFQQVNGGGHVCNGWDGVGKINIVLGVGDDIPCLCHLFGYGKILEVLCGNRHNRSFTLYPDNQPHLTGYILLPE